MNDFSEKLKPYSPITKPIFRWVGGKTWSLKILNSLISSVNYENYFEPFFGGGALFFSFEQKNKSFLFDLNEDLIKTYIDIRDRPNELVNKIKSFESNEKFYYSLRDSNPKNDLDRSARFLYLNKTSFNGIYRVNQNGKFNVPYGKKSFDVKSIEKHLFIVSEKLQNLPLVLVILKLQ